MSLRKIAEPILTLATPRTDLPFLEFQTQDNPRGVSLIDALDIPATEAQTVMADLRLKGVTADSVASWVALVSTRQMSGVLF